MEQKMCDKTINLFIQELSDKQPVPGGGGASALVGALGVALLNMDAIYTTGNEKFKDVEEEIKEQKEEQKTMLLETYSRKSNSSHEGDSKALEKALKNYDLYTDDYLQLDKKFAKIQEEKISFMEKINIQLNIKNATTEIEIDI